MEWKSNLVLAGLLLFELSFIAWLACQILTRLNPLIESSHRRRMEAMDKVIELEKVKYVQVHSAGGGEPAGALGSVASASSLELADRHGGGGSQPGGGESLHQDGPTGGG